MNASNHSRSSPLRRQVSWTLPANIFYAGCSWLLLVVLNKFAPTAAEGQRAAGEFGHALAICAPAIMFGNLRLSNILATDTSERIRLASYFQLRAVFLVAASLWVVATITFHQGPLVHLLLIVLVAKVIESMSELCCGVQQKIQRMDRIAVSLGASGALMVTLFGSIFYWTQSLVFASLGIVVARILVLVVYDAPRAWRASRREIFAAHEDGPSAGTYTTRVLCQALPLGLTTVLLSLTSNIPRYQIVEFHSEEVLGVFCSVAAVMQAGTFVFRAIEQPVSPRLANLIREGNSAGVWRILNALLIGFLILGLVGAGLASIIGPALLGAVFRPEYATLGNLLALLVLVTSITQMAGIVEASMIAARIIRPQLLLHAVTTLCCLGTGWWLIPRFELMGAVVALGICRFPFMVIGVWLLRQKLREDPTGISVSASRAPETEPPVLGDSAPARDEAA